jgi:hypothetical protein
MARRIFNEQSPDVAGSSPPPAQATNLSEADRTAITAKVVELLRGQNKPLNEMSAGELDRYADEAWRRAFPSLYRGTK